MYKIRGFTLLEVMVVVVIAGTVIFTTPAFLEWFRQQGVTLAVDQLRTDLQLARIMAISKKQQCAILLHSPEDNQYINSLNNKKVLLSGYRGGVHFLNEGPDGRRSASKICFNRQGMSTSVSPQDIFIADREHRSIFRIRIMLPGGISVYRWSANRWY